MLSSPLLYLLSLANGINANKGTENCVHCALRLDKHLAAGENLSFGPVPKGKAHLYLNPLIEEGKIIRSTSTDGRLANKAAPNTDFIEICNLDEPQQKWIIDTTVNSNNEGVRLLKADSDNIHSLLVDLPRRALDGTAYGLIVLTTQTNTNDGHMLNYYVTADNQVYFIDSQEHNTENQVKQTLDLTAFREEIFYLPSRPPEGLKIKIEHAILEIKEEPIEIAAPVATALPETNESKSLIQQSEFRKLFADEQLIDSMELDKTEVKVNIKAEYTNKEYHKFIYGMLFNCCLLSATAKIRFRLQSRGYQFYLILDEDHPFKNGDEVLKEFIKYAQPRKLHVRAALANGDLIKYVTLNDNKVTLHLKDEYDDKANYLRINRALKSLHIDDRGSDCFSTKFMQPTASARYPALELKANHGFKDANEVLNFMQSCAGKNKKEVQAEALPAINNPNKQVSNFKKLLMNGELIESIQLIDNKAFLNFKGEYSNKQYFKSINWILKDLLNYSRKLDGVFQVRSENKQIIYFTLESDHQFKNGEALLKALINHANTKPKIAKSKTHEPTFEENIVPIEAEFINNNRNAIASMHEHEAPREFIIRFKRKLPLEFEQSRMNEKEAVQSEKRLRKE